MRKRVSEAFRERELNVSILTFSFRLGGSIAGSRALAPDALES